MAKHKELDKMQKVQNQSQTIGEFLGWLSEQKIWLSKYDTDQHYDRLFPLHTGTEQLLADYFEIDLDKAEKERQALLDEVREQNK